jgi:hypothetical protein
MVRLTFAVLVLGISLAAAAERKNPSAYVENQQVGIAAMLFQGKDAIREELGSDLGGYFAVLKVTVTPKDGKPLPVFRDDFLLRSDKDGQRSQPFAPSQIAGRGALVISSNGRGGGVMAENPGPVWGGMPGTGGRPGRLGGDSANIGNSGESSAEATVNTGNREKDDPLLAVLKDKVLPEKETTEPLSGLLYFSLEGKHKPKDLELRYAGPAGKLSLRFR